LRPALVTTAQDATLGTRAAHKRIIAIKTEAIY